MSTKRRTPGTYVQQVHDETQRCLTDLKSQNERLRLQAAALDSERTRLQQEKLRLQEQLMDARTEIAARQEEHDSLIRRLKDVERENERVAGQFLDIEAQNTNLANLYVASYQLRSLDRGQILAAMKEIIVNLIGSEDFAIYERFEGSNELTLIDSFETHSRIARQIRVGDGLIGSVAASGEPHIDSDRSLSPGITACIPLRVDDDVIGVIAVFRLLPQKADALESLDLELFDLLATHAGMALYCSRLQQLSLGRGAAAEMP